MTPPRREKLRLFHLTSLGQLLGPDLLFSHCHGPGGVLAVSLRKALLSSKHNSSEPLGRSRAASSKNTGTAPAPAEAGQQRLRSSASAFGPGNCVSITRDDGTGTCGIETRCAAAADLRAVEFGFVCVQEHQLPKDHSSIAGGKHGGLAKEAAASLKAKTRFHSFGRGTFQHLETWTSRVGPCQACLAPPAEEGTTRGQAPAARIDVPVRSKKERTTPIGSEKHDRSSPAGKDARSPEATTLLQDIEKSLERLGSRVAKLESDAHAGASFGTKGENGEPSLAEIVQKQFNDYSPFDEELFATKEQTSNASPDKFGVSPSTYALLQDQQIHNGSASSGGVKAARDSGANAARSVYRGGSIISPAVGSTESSTVAQVRQGLAEERQRVALLETAMNDVSEY
ncbi:unnamed protein product [Amoebophrya sp. A120]|nr:unnamed protein product [Amoebophrya sp. A120]|eukprot:GSA120T00023054001.1